MTVKCIENTKLGNLSLPTASVDQIKIQQIISIFDLVPELLFWIKDIDSQMVHVNKPLRQHWGVNDKQLIAGLTDFDFYPDHIARQFIKDDKKVMNGVTIANRLEIGINYKGESMWYVTSKKPLFDDNQNIIGTYGISHQLERVAADSSGMDEIKNSVDYIKENYMHDINISELAHNAHMSVSTLGRKFKKCINKNPRQFITEVRLENARRLLVETNLPISVICSKSGFADHSYFSRKFAQMFDDIPSVLRSNYHKTGAR